MPANPVALWVPNWTPEWSASFRVSQIPGIYNVLGLFHAVPSGGNGSITYTPASLGTAMRTNFNADVAAKRAAGVKCILTVGGAGAQIPITNKTEADNFITSVKSINVQLGGAGTTRAIDGLDFNSYEGAPASGDWLTYVAMNLKDFYGSTFLILSPPAIHGQSPGGQADLDRKVLAQMHLGYLGAAAAFYTGTYQGTALDCIFPQCYDGPGNAPSSGTTLAEAIQTVQDTLDWYHADVVINGVTTAIPRNKIGIGFGITTALPNYWTGSQAATCYSTMVANGRQPKGSMNWAMHLDLGYLFGSTVAPVITNNAEVSTSIITKINGILYTSVTKINGIAKALITQWK